MSQRNIPPGVISEVKVQSARANECDTCCHANAISAAVNGNGNVAPTSAGFLFVSYLHNPPCSETGGRGNKRSSTDVRRGNTGSSVPHSQGEEAGLFFSPRESLRAYLKMDSVSVLNTCLNPFPNRWPPIEDTKSDCLCSD